MFKKGRGYIIIALFTMVFLLLLHYGKPKEVNWFPSFATHHKIPYGTYVLKDLTNTIFEDNMRQVYIPPFEFLNAEEPQEGTYFFCECKS